ncbi:AcrR family transcriptional regulator [Thermocatellispora tengchongensis]|uniref:AcrR family transcriptional regulator n=1 Tax=Thermocatellispora tengchongensis TaxID=1073253 RepID=A0A840NRB6_9ACTN|nr:TetR/AcrR family transcriptional regulator C-terminal domain-containing protein [Thermocatellispora tengchongensis]MBB5131164.1 AcrR family transcriptional regulator [Thermocatellispora tengchongensis]
MDTDADSLPIPPWRTPRKQVSRREPLSQDVIVDTGLRIVDAEGLDALSMRRVAQVLGTGPASLYAHVANKEELLALIYDRVLGEIELPERPDPERWVDQMRAIALASYEVFRAHKDVAKVGLAAVPTGPNALRIAEAQFSIMIAGGVPPRLAGWMMDRLGLYVAADAYEGTLYQGRHTGDTPQEAAENFRAYFQGIADYYRSLPRDRFPAIVDHVDDLISGDGEVRFRFGLDLLLAGLEAMVRR